MKNQHNSVTIRAWLKPNIISFLKCAQTDGAGDGMEEKFRFIFLLVGWITLTGLLSINGSTYQKKVSEYKVKALLIMKFLYFVKWPEKIDEPGNQSSIILGLMGRNPFGSYLEERCAITGTKGRQIKFKKVRSFEEIAGCNALFISGSRRKDLLKILAVTRGKPILTIGDTKGFSKKGVHINLLLKKNKRIGFGVNPETLKDSSLSVSSVLLRYAEISTSRGRGRSDENI